MTAVHEAAPRPWRPGGRSLAFALVVLGSVSGARAARGPECLTPEVGRVLERVVASGGLQPALRADFTLNRGDVRDNQIEFEFEDDKHRSYELTLVLPESKAGVPDGEGRHFLFYLAVPPGPPNPQASAALLAAASILDQAVPESAISSCGQSLEVRSPRAFALASAAMQAAVLLLAIIFGLRTIGAMEYPPNWRSRRSGGD